MAAYLFTFECLRCTVDTHVSLRRQLLEFAFRPCDGTCKRCGLINKHFTAPNGAPVKFACARERMRAQLAASVRAAAHKQLYALQ